MENQQRVVHFYESWIEAHLMGFVGHVESGMEITKTEQVDYFELIRLHVEIRKARALEALWLHRVEK